MSPQIIMYTRASDDITFLINPGSLGHVSLKVTEAIMTLNLIEDRYSSYAAIDYV